MKDEGRNDDRRCANAAANKDGCGGEGRKIGKRANG